MSEQAKPFAHLGTDNAATYRAVLRVFSAARTRYVLHLRPEDVVEDLAGAGTAIGIEPVDNALTSLVAWGNLRADPDTGRVTTVEDFHRARYLYQLTPEGQAAERALSVYEESLGRRGALQAVALEDIAEHLRSLVTLLEDPRPLDAARAQHLLTALTQRLETLAENAAAFMASMQRSIDLQDADLDAFVAYKDRLVDYLERFLSDLVTVGAQISDLVLRAEAADVHAALSAVAEREAVDVAPGDGATEDLDHAAERVLEVWDQRWRGVRTWFVGSRETPSQKDVLRRRGRSAIPQLLRAVQVINERRSGRSDRSADFRRLALWFAQAPDDSSRHRIWHNAFGLSPARHLSIDSDTLTAREAGPRTVVSWTEAEPLRISPQFRRTGRHERRGRPARVQDRSAQRRHLAELAAVQREQLRLARSELLTDGPGRLADLPDLSGPAFTVFLGLLGQAVAARRPDVPGAPCEATSADGSLQVRITLDPAGVTVPVRSEHGTLHLPDGLVEIRDTAPEGPRP
ncbi:TIGR02677 family protein [Kineococcus sp. NPDC059986]|uniref:TIGR02677 family protein n=1 Tax=Kineococcus sp. NPDC059986 TaxID=3155538 RepID=UPI00344C2444